MQFVKFTAELWDGANVEQAKPLIKYWLFKLLQTALSVELITLNGFSKFGQLEPDPDKVVIKCDDVVVTAKEAAFVLTCCTLKRETLCSAGAVVKEMAEVCWEFALIISVKLFTLGNSVYSRVHFVSSAFPGGQYNAGEALNF